MKKLYLLVFLTVLIGYAACGQTVIPPTTTVVALSAMKAGVYRFPVAKDTSVDLALDFSIVCPKVDTAAIQALKVCAVCPPPIVCPVCPPTKQRSVVSITEINTATKKTTTILFDDNSVQIF